MPSIEKLNEITGNIIAAKNKKEKYLYQIESLEKGNIKHASMNLEFISKYARSSGSVDMSQEEILLVLKNRLKEAETNLSFFNEKFNNLS